MTPLVPEGPTPVSPRASSFTLGGVAFGPWQLDIAAQSLWRQGVCLQLTPLQFAVLQLLTANAGSVVSKQTLLTKVWGDVAVGDNSIERLMSDLRMILDADDRRQYIQTMTRRGYVFVAPVRRIEPPAQVEVESLLEPYRACLEGRVALQTLTREEILRARGIYQNLATQYPDRAAYHGGLAMACALVFESTRADVNPDIETLTVALSHARTACQLNPAVAEPFATLGFILERVGDRSGAIGALERACALEPENWLHNYRLAAVSWGQARHRAARSVLQQCPGFPMAHLLVATVLVARQRCVDAEAEVDAGIKALRDGETDGAQFLSVAVYYLKGLLCLSRGAVDDALAAFDAELALEGRGHFYARECCANVWYAKGVCFMRREDHDGADAAFHQALERVRQHPLALAGLEILNRRKVTSSSTFPAEQPTSRLTFEREMARAALCVDAGGVAEAVAILVAALRVAPPGNAGWWIPLDPLLRVWETPDEWAPVLQLLTMRAL